jgi:hypothetical protein
MRDSTSRFEAWSVVLGWNTMLVPGVRNQRDGSVVVVELRVGGVERVLWALNWLESLEASPLRVQTLCGVCSREAEAGEDREVVHMAKK